MLFFIFEKPETEAAESFIWRLASRNVVGVSRPPADNVVAISTSSSSFSDCLSSSSSPPFLFSASIAVCSNTRCRCCCCAIAFDTDSAGTNNSTKRYRRRLPLLPAALRSIIDGDACPTCSPTNKMAGWKWLLLPCGWHNAGAGKQLANTTSNKRAEEKKILVVDWTMNDAW